MSSGIPYLGKGAKIAAKKELISPSGDMKKQKHQTLEEEATPTT